MKPIIFPALIVALAGCTAASTMPVQQSAQNASIARPQFSSSRVVYTVPANACSITGCTNAPLEINGATVATLSYTDGIRYFSNSNLIGTVTISGTLYRDLAGTWKDIGTTTIGGLSYSLWKIYGKFDGGRSRLSERFAVRGHSGRGGGTTIVNVGGVVTTPLVTPAPTPTPSPTPTPKPTPTDN